MKCTEEKKKVKGWSIDEMKDKPSGSLEEYAGEMIEYDLVVPFMEAFGLEVESIGQKESGRENGITSTKKPG